MVTTMATTIFMMVMVVMVMEIMVMMMAMMIGGDVAIRLSYVLERCPHFDPESSGGWTESWGGYIADAPVAQEYSVLAKWQSMTRDFDDYATRLSTALNEIGTVRRQHY